ncbi:MAG: winged helix-turn-helix transcriptional regulator [Spirochaetia bacterium]|nr:winged helix-turn-helix transcriptional regulator [Spirochaetia bacterium]
MKELDFEQYIREGEPDQKEKSIAWSIATGLQQVDGLTPSPYLYSLAKRNIEGEISIKEVKQLIESYYESRKNRTAEEEKEREADEVSSRITELVEEKSFSFNINQLLSIHERLFKGVLFRVKAGKFRSYNITKKEWALDGDTVLYAPYELIEETLRYDFDEERKFNYSKLSKEEIVDHITQFVANIWQVHPFGEGNTRTTAVFVIKYLRSLGFIVGNEPFKTNSWYFRNSLVRANYSNVKKGIYSNLDFLRRFFRNLLFGEGNELKNRFTHIRYTEKITEKSHKSHSKITVNLTRVQQNILEAIAEDNSISQNELAQKLSLARETINRNMKKLKDMGLIKRVGAKKNGHWDIE